MTDVLFEQTQLVPLGTLKAYDKNPRRGNVEAIAESLSINKQYRPIVVQKSTKKILAGNHTFKAAQQLGWEEIAVVMVDVTDEEAVRIMLADNRTNDLAEYDNQVLAELLKDIGDSAGTGYNATDVENLIATMDSTVTTVADTSNAIREETLIQTDDSLMDVEAIRRAAPEADQSDIEEGAGDDLTGAYTLKETVNWSGHGFWEIPILRDDMMIEELPDPLTTWAGSATRDMAWDGYWLYNWGIDSTSGMDDLSKIVLSFYTWDEYFECWWNDPVRYLSKAINSKIKYAITPNYTPGGMPMAESLFALYRSRWIGRYLQEVGIRVAVDLEMRHEPEYRDIALGGLPKPLPWASTQIQNLDAATRGGKGEDPALRQAWVKSMRAIIQEAQVQNLLVYCTTSRWPEARQWFDGLGINLAFLPTRIELLSAKQKNNKRDPKRL